MIKIGAIAGLSSVILVMLMGQSRVFFSMSKDGLMPKVFSEVHPKFRTPAKNNLLFMVIVSLFAAFVPARVVGEMTSIGTLFAFILVCIGVLIMRKKMPEAPRAFRTPFVPFVPIAGVVVCLFMMVFLPLDTWIRLIVWMMIGFDLYLFYGMKHSVLNKGAFSLKNYKNSDRPSEKFLLSPRAGFRWDTKKDNSLIVRGGAGIFTGRIPFVWLTNAPQNSGVIQFGGRLRNSNTAEAALLAGVRLTEDPSTYRGLFPAVGAPSAPGNIVFTDPDFKFPSIFRTNLAIDKKLGKGYSLTLEGLFSKDINGVVMRNANNKAPNAAIVDGPNSSRLRYTNTASRDLNSNITTAIVLENTNKGYSGALTALLAKDFTTNFYGSLGYTYTNAKDVTTNPGAICQLLISIPTASIDHTSIPSPSDIMTAPPIIARLPSVGILLPNNTIVAVIPTETGSPVNAACMALKPRPIWVNKAKVRKKPAIVTWNIRLIKSPAPNDLTRKSDGCTRADPSLRSFRRCDQTNSSRTGTASPIMTNVQIGQSSSLPWMSGKTSKLRATTTITVPIISNFSGCGDLPSGK
jgi:hypothetical protein